MKGIKLVSISLLMLVVSIILVACGNSGGGNGNGMPKLDPAIEAQMKVNWQDQFGSPLRFDAYYGTFNGTVVIFVAGDASIFTERTIAGVTFAYGWDWQIYVWSNNVFYILENAYPKILTQPNVVAIGKRHVQHTAK